MKKINYLLLSAFAGGLTVSSLNAAVLGEWNFDNQGTVSTALSSSNLDAGVSILSSLQFNTSGGFGFDSAGVNAVPDTLNDGYGFGGNSGEQVAFIHRATYFDGSSVPDPRPTVDDYTSFGEGALEGTTAALGNGNAPLSFSITAGLQGLRIDSLMIDTTNANADLIVGFQRAGDAAGSTVTLNSGNLMDTADLTSSIVVSAGTSQTFTISLNSGSLNTGHVVNEFVLNGAVIPEPGTYALMAGTLALGAVMLRRRRD